MRKLVVFMITLCVAAAAAQAHVWGEIQTDYDLFTEAKILIFDKKWKQAQRKLDELLENHSDSRYYALALFYKGKCLDEQKGTEEDALAVFKRFLRQSDAGDHLKEEAENSIVDLAIELYQNGKRSYLVEAEKRLRSSSRAIRYYAAIQLSFVDDPGATERALGVLQEILDESRDDELRDRAKLAILRIDPDAFEEFGEEPAVSGASVLCIRILKDGLRRPTFKLNIPWALADLAFSAISEEDKARIRREGYDIDRIIRQLLNARGEILEIYDKEEGVTIQIWIKSPF